MKKKIIKQMWEKIQPLSLYLFLFERREREAFDKYLKEINPPLLQKVSSDRIRKDYFRALRKYGVTLECYLCLDFYTKNHKQRDIYVAPGRLVAIWNSLNKAESRCFLDDKVKYLQKFKKYINRDYLAMETVEIEQYLDFCQKYSKIIVKKSNGYGGKGTTVFEPGQYTREQLLELYKEYVENKCVLEEYIYQTGVLHDLNPNSVNCVRVCTMRRKSGVEVFQCFSTMGNGDACVDNTYAGGLFAPIDIAWNAFEKHPVSGIQILGLEIPYWKEIKQLALQAADELPDIVYISWDIAVSEDGRLYLIEGNSCGEALWLKDEGEWDYFKSVLKEYRCWKQYKKSFVEAIKENMWRVIKN